MADPLSLTATAAGFIGLAGQLAQGVIKLKEIYTTINDAPQDVANLCSKMELLQGVLEEVGEQIQQLSRGNINLDIRTLRDVITQCETSRYRVEAHVKRLKDGFRLNRGAAMKYVFKKKELEEMLSDVEQCKSSLIIARQSIDGAVSNCRHQTLLQQHATLSTANQQLLQQTSRVETIVEAVSTQQRLDFDTISHQVAMASQHSRHGYQSLQDAQRASSSRISESLLNLQRQLHSQHEHDSSRVILARIEDIQRDIQASNRNPEHLVSRPLDDSHRNSALATKRVKVGFQSTLFSFSVEFSSEHEERQTEGHAVAHAVKKSVCTIRLPNWFVQDQYNLAIARSKNGWLFHPSMYRTVEYYSPFFMACRHGNIEEMKMLLTTKQAFLGDRSFSGRSAICYAFDNFQLEACRLLIRAGILSTFQSSDYSLLLEEVAYNVTASTEERSEGRELLRLVEPERNLGDDWLDDFQLTGITCKVVRDLRSYAEEIGGSDLHRFEALMLPATFGNIDPEFNLHAISEFLRDTNHVQAIRDAAVESAWLLFVIVQNICELFLCRADEHDLRKEPIQAGGFALTVMCDSRLDLHAPYSSLPGVWQEWLTPRWLATLNFYNGTPFAFIFAECLSSMSLRYDNRTSRVLNQVIKLWATTLHEAGVDLTAYAAQEVRIINRILMWARTWYQITYRFSHGPQPDDWKVELGPPGEAHPANFWRGIEAAPIEEDLAARVLAVVLRVEHPFGEHCEVPGAWQAHRHALEEPSWKVMGWLACMDDDGLAEVEADLEQLGDEEFYEVWDLSSVVEEWPYIEKWPRPLFWNEWGLLE